MLSRPTFDKHPDQSDVKGGAVKSCWRSIRDVDALTRQFTPMRTERDGLVKNDRRRRRRWGTVPTALGLALVLRLSPLVPGAGQHRQARVLGEAGIHLGARAAPEHGFARGGARTFLLGGQGHVFGSAARELSRPALSFGDPELHDRTSLQYVRAAEPTR